MQAVQSLPAHVIVEGLPKAVISTFLKITPGTLKEMSTNEINLNSVDFKLVEALMPFQREGVRYIIFYPVHCCFFPSFRQWAKHIFVKDSGLII